MGIAAPPMISQRLWARLMTAGLKVLRRVPWVR
jgi:hypothetical protein